MNFITQGTVLCIPEAQLLNVGLWETQSLSDFTAYTYNADGIRTSKTVNGVKHEYILNGSQILAEKWTQNNVEYVLVYIYDETGAPIGLKYRTSNYANGVFDSFFFEKNLQGDIVAIYNSTGEKIGIYAYTAFGEMVVTTVSGNTTLENNVVNNYNPFRYRGYYYDVETGWYYLQSRYYNPTWGRFISADGYVSTGTGLIGYNMFAYCNNNPVNYFDPKGDSIIGIIALVLLGGGMLVGMTSSTPVDSNVSYHEHEPIDPSKPPNPESGYIPPKKNPNPQKVKNPNGPGRGWLDNEGAVWVPDNNQDGGPGWVQQYPDGSHKHRYPSGHVRSHPASNSSANLMHVILGGALVVGAGAAIVWIVSNDFTGVGVVDDGALPALVGVFSKGVELIGAH